MDEARERRLDEGEAAEAEPFLSGTGDASGRPGDRIDIGDTNVQSSDEESGAAATRTGVRRGGRNGLCAGGEATTGSAATRTGIGGGGMSGLAAGFGG